MSEESKTEKKPYSVFTRWLDSLQRKGYTISIYYDFDKETPITLEDVAGIEGPTKFSVTCEKLEETDFKPIEYECVVTPPRKGSEGVTPPNSPPLYREITALVNGYEKLVSSQQACITAQNASIVATLEANSNLVKEVLVLRQNEGNGSDTMLMKGFELLSTVLPHAPLIVGAIKDAFKKEPTPVIANEAPKLKEEPATVIETTMKVEGEDGKDSV